MPPRALGASRSNDPAATPAILPLESRMGAVKVTTGWPVRMEV